MYFHEVNDMIMIKIKSKKLTCIFEDNSENFSLFLGHHVSIHPILHWLTWQVFDQLCILVSTKIFRLFNIQTIVKSGGIYSDFNILILPWYFEVDALNLGEKIILSLQ